MTLAVSVVCYNRPALLYRMLNSLATQNSKNWKVVIVNDNSPNPEVEKMSLAFCQEYDGVYINSEVKESERLDKCRGAVCINLALPEMNRRGEIFFHIADDMEFGSPDAVGIILNHFESHPESKAGYFGIGYRMADFRTGRIFVHGELAGLIHEHSGNVRFAEMDIPMRTYTPDYGYGGKLKDVFACLDGGQIAYHKSAAVLFPEGKEYWMGEDAFAFQSISTLVGGLDPIGDVHFPLVISNLNEASLSATKDPAKSIAVTQ